ncbi:MAG: hypothetical protein FJY88_00215 [Candidatus Eisenbacteria bacterium]|nr:hypothetical protein [Candidatus Eisenbacteria bacterium]
MPSRFSRGSEDLWGDEKPGNPIFKAIFARSWFLVVPLIAMWWFEARKIDPMAKQIDAKIAEHRQGIEVTRTSSLAAARKMGVRISLLRAVGDTFQVRFAQMGDLLDSLRVLEGQERTEIRMLEAQAESLRAVFSEAQGKMGVFSDRLSVLQARVDSLRTLIAERGDETARLETEISTDKDLADRILRPDAYRKNSALVTGSGDFPNRDDLPKR